MTPSGRWGLGPGSDTQWEMGLGPGGWFGVVPASETGAAGGLRKASGSGSTRLLIF